MKLMVLSFFLFCSQFVYASKDVTAVDLVGDYSLIGNAGFLNYDLNFSVDATGVSLNQKIADHTDLICNGTYVIDKSSEDFIAAYNCQDGTIMTQEMSFKGIDSLALVKGVSLPVHIKSSLGTDSIIVMEFKKK
ncbi:MAG: hypothetical protein ACXVB4_02085 [Pseudobdellovibrionaceae bacterium]